MDGVSPRGSQGRNVRGQGFFAETGAADGGFLPEPLGADFGVPALHGFGTLTDLVGREVEAA